MRPANIFAWLSSVIDARQMRQISSVPMIQWRAQRFVFSYTHFHMHNSTRHPLLFAHNKWPATARRRIRTTLDKPFFSPFRLLRCICIYYNRILHPTFAQSHPKSRSQHFVAKVQLAYTTVIIHVRNEQNVSPDKN